MNPINTKKVSGRRELRFETLDDVVADVNNLLAGDHKTLGNWTLAQILGHLSATASMNLKQDMEFKAGFFLRLMCRFMKNRFINKPLPAGFTQPEYMRARLVPDESLQLVDAAKEFFEVMSQYKIFAGFPPKHPMFGSFSTDDWQKLNLRHCELHLSFVVLDS